MTEPLKRLWKFLNTDVGDLFSAETAKGGVESAKAVLELAKTLKEQGSNVGQLAPLVGEISTLLDVLNSPLAQVVGAGLPFISIATGLLTFYLEKSKQEQTLALCVALVGQGAYLESLKAILALPENQPLLEQIGKTPVSEAVEKQIAKLGDLELDLAFHGMWKKGIGSRRYAANQLLIFRCLFGQIRQTLPESINCLL